MTTAADQTDPTPLAVDLAAPRLKYSDAEVIAGLREYAAKVEPPYSARSYHQSEPRIGVATLRTRYGSFRAACKAAGLDTEGVRRLYSDEEMISFFEEVCRHRLERGFAGSPADTDFDRYRAERGEGPTRHNYFLRYGSYRDFLQAYVAYQKGEVTRAELIERLKQNKGSKRGAISPRLYAETLARFDHRCTACGRRAVDLDAGEWLEVDHITPVAMGGTDAAENLTVRCSRDNRGKGARFAG